MKLSTYRKKRRFTRTPEPEGGKTKGNDFRFVIHEHRARRKHYDLRLALGGVLKCWALPKGLPLTIKEKFLAVPTEDHPLEYATFEGTIPRGNYGAGQVILWDRGTFRLSEGVTEEAALRKLRQGHLKFTLHGTKIRGSFVLVRTATQSRKQSWLILRLSGDQSEERLTEVWGASVKSQRTWQDLAVSSSNAAFPDDLRPMLATPSKRLPEGKGFVFEPKWDGYRVIAVVKDGSVVLKSRRGNVLNERFPTIVRALKAFPLPCALDGEIVAGANGGSFQALQNASTKRLRYMLFDLLVLDGNDLRPLPWTERRRLLEELAKSFRGIPAITITPVKRTGGPSYFRTMTKRGYEGVIAKSAQSTYRSGERSRDWVKIKGHNAQEFLVIGFTKPKGSRREFGALVLGTVTRGTLTFAGSVGTGFSDRSLASIAKELRKLRRNMPAASVPEDLTDVMWVEPRMVVSVRYREWTEEGLLRQPVFEGVREDISPEELLTGEVPGGGKEVQSPHRFVPTNIEKVFWPEEGITKGDLLKYYEVVAPFILPYLIDRPLTLLRYPHGIEGEWFYQKDATGPGFAGMPRWPVPSESSNRVTQFVLCQDRTTLLKLINLACIDLHPWNSRIPDLDKPDYLIMDLDPLDIPFAKVVETALAVRHLLTHLEVEAYCKTSGKRGLHIFIPLQATYSTTQSRMFAEILARLISRKLPDITSTERSPKKRSGKVYVDFLQNRRGQTLSAPYAVRPWPGATVSMPLKWSEVRRGLDPKRFTIRTVPKLLSSRGDLWKPVLGRGIDIDRALTLLRREGIT